MRPLEDLGCPSRHNSALQADGSLRADYMNRLQRVLDKADELGMVVILGLFYFGQDERLKDEEAVQRGVDNALDWLFDQGYRNVLIEVNNEAGRADVLRLFECSG